MNCDLAILGGGIMGLASAVEEARRGKKIVVLDPNPVGHKASWAAAGILVARGGLLGRSPLREFYMRSLYGYPEWIAGIEKESGKSVAYERCGDYQIFPADNAESIRRIQARERQLTRDRATRYSVEDVLPDFLRRHSKLEKVRVFYFPDESRVNNRILLEALEAAARKLGVEFLPHKPIMWSVTGRGSDLSGTGWNVQAKKVLVGAGAWCNDALSLLGLSVSMTPVKGQLAMLYDFHGGREMIHCEENFYLIPRDGKLIAGATTELGTWEDGFDETGDLHLGGMLNRFFPDVKPEWVESWSGLRPRTGDRLPLMGWIDKTAGIAICTGHYKSGISMAPLAARCMSALLNNERPTEKLEAFSPWRSTGMKKL